MVGSVRSLLKSTLKYAMGENQWSVDLAIGYVILHCYLTKLQHSLCTKNIIILSSVELLSILSVVFELLSIVSVVFGAKCPSCINNTIMLVV